MSLKIHRWLIPSLAILTVGIAAAQSGEGVAPPQDLTAQRDTKLTPQQMLTEANKHVARIEQGARGVRGQLKRARQERDVVKVLCLNDKLNQIDVALASAGDREKSLEALVKENDVDRSKHEFTIISVLRERAEALVAEANQCVGEELGYLGETEVTVDIDPEIPDTDPSEFPDEPFVSEVPRLSSPVL